MVIPPIWDVWDHSCSTPSSLGTQVQDRWTSLWIWPCFDQMMLPDDVTSNTNYSMTLTAVFSWVASCLLTLTVHAWMLLMSFIISSSRSHLHFPIKRALATATSHWLLFFLFLLFSLTLQPLLYPCLAEQSLAGHTYVCVKQRRFWTKELRSCWQTKHSLSHKHFLAPILLPSRM